MSMLPDSQSSVVHGWLCWLCTVPCSEAGLPWTWATNAVAECLPRRPPYTYYRGAHLIQMCKTILFSNSYTRETLAPYQYQCPHPCPQDQSEWHRVLTSVESEHSHAVGGSARLGLHRQHSSIISKTNRGCKMHSNKERTSHHITCLYLPKSFHVLRSVLLCGTVGWSAAGEARGPGQSGEVRVLVTL